MTREEFVRILEQFGENTSEAALKMHIGDEHPPERELRKRQYRQLIAAFDILTERIAELEHYLEIMKSVVGEEVTSEDRYIFESELLNRCMARMLKYEDSLIKHKKRIAELEATNAQYDAQLLATDAMLTEAKGRIEELEQ